MKFIIIITFLIITSVSSAQGNKSDLKITFVEGRGYYMNVYDFSPEMMGFMKKRKLHGGGPTWITLLETALKKESPDTLKIIELDDESSAVQVRSKSKSSIKKVQIIAEKLMTNRKYLIKYINIASSNGFLE